MAISVKSLETKIINSLQILNTNEKKVLLAVAETLVKEHKQQGDSLLSDEQKSELNTTLSEHKAGKLKYYTLNQAKKILREK